MDILKAFILLTAHVDYALISIIVWYPVFYLNNLFRVFQNMSLHLLEKAYLTIVPLLLLKMN